MLEGTVSHTLLLLELDQSCGTADRGIGLLFGPPVEVFDDVSGVPLAARQPFG
jgi:hypothetical protein